MLPNQPMPSESVSYFFTRSKDVHEENGTLYITLFARLTKEFIKTRGAKTFRKVESVWVDIEEMQMEHAPEKIRSMPNLIQRYNISKEVFAGLFKVSADSPKELYFVTPISSFKKA